jgi:hypothetical protein
MEYIFNAKDQGFLCLKHNQKSLEQNYYIDKSEGTSSPLGCINHLLLFRTILPYTAKKHHCKLFMKE